MGSAPLTEAIQALLTALSSAGDTITRFVRYARAAHVDLVTLTRELSELRLTLELLRADTEHVPSELHPRIAGVLRSCEAVTGRIDAILAACWSGTPGELGKSAWGANDKSAVGALKTSLQLHREALGLSLEVANLTSRKDNIAFVTGAEDGAEEFKIEADRVLVETTLLQRLVPQTDDSDSGLVSSIHQYLNDVVVYVKQVGSTVSTEQRVKDGPGNMTGVQPYEPDTGTPEKEAVTGRREHGHHDREDSDKMLAAEIQTLKDPNFPFEFQQPLEAAGPWYPPGDGVVPFYNEPNPPPIPPRNIHRRTGSGMGSDSQFRRRPVAAFEPRPALAPALTPAEGVSPVSKRTSSQRSYDGAPSLFDSPPQPSSVRTSTTTMDTAGGSPRPSPLGRTFSYPASISESTSGNSSQTIERGVPSPLPSYGAEVFTHPQEHLGENAPGLQMELVPSKRLFDKDKSTGIFYLDVSAARSVLASQHANHHVKIWSLATNTLQSVIKVSSKVRVEPRSRNYFIRSHAIVSESMAMVAVSASFGNTLELWNWARRRRVQSIDRAFRWAAVRDDAWRSWRGSLAVYRGEVADAIDLFDFSRDPGFKEPFRLGARIELKQAGLPFLLKYPELAFSTTEPLLVGVAGPRARDPPNAQRPMLVAWHTGQGPEQSHVPWRWTISEHEELHMALPSGLVAHGNVAVSTWIPASHRPVLVPGGYWNKPVSVTSRYILIWEMEENKTRILPMPNVQSAISPDGRFVAYCDAAGGKFAVIETSSGREVWSWPNERLLSLPHFNQLDDLSKVTDFAFSVDGGLVVVGDSEGGIGVYEIWQQHAQSQGNRGELDSPQSPGMDTSVPNI
ncbi:WD40 repeat-like-containing domain [Pleurostoma richardsiae]|uniref:WD40 repeat-like-containing domain n=1 Tax=Pleurostoma richardsiae TaxID=41990 RepID=A0AA38RDZ5_9PEZI|nr:WD40 repeat-like-containing domain [Pleurostoma richardsiae]